MEFVEYRQILFKKSKRFAQYSFFFLIIDADVSQTEGCIIMSTFCSAIVRVLSDCLCKGRERPVLMGVTLL